MVKYEPEILTILAEIFRDQWMSNEEWIEFTALFKENGLDMQKLSDAIQQGVDNGHPLKEQLSMIKQFFNSPQWDKMKKIL